VGDEGAKEVIFGDIMTLAYNTVVTKTRIIQPAVFNVEYCIVRYDFLSLYVFATFHSVFMGKYLDIKYSNIRSR